MKEIAVLIQEMQDREAKRIKRIQEQIKRGCDKCSQWDDYNGCDKCEGGE